MERSSEDARYNDIQQSTWSFLTETDENSTPGTSNEIKQAQLSANPSVLKDGSMYTNKNQFPDGKDLYINKLSYMPQPGTVCANNDEKMSFKNISNINITHQNYGNAMLSLDNGHLLRVFYDENNGQLIFPAQYELFKNNQGLCDIPLSNTQQNHIFSDNYLANNNVNTCYKQDNREQSSMPTSNILKEVLDNLEPKPNPSGSYSPFGQGYPTNHTDSSSFNLLNNKPLIEVPMKQNSPKRNENSPLSDTNNKKRIVAEVKPMRPSYSDVLAKNTKNSQPENVHKVKQQHADIKLPSSKNVLKNEKPTNIKSSSSEDKQKTDKKQINTLSSGSESGDVNDIEKSKSINKSKHKRNNMPHKWSLIDNMSTEGDEDIGNDTGRQFIFIENQPSKNLKTEKNNIVKPKYTDEDLDEANSKQDEESQSEFVLQDNQSDASKSKKKREKSYHKIAKLVNDKKKSVPNKVKRSKSVYLALAQNYLEHWGDATWKALVWFFYLLSDVFRMSAHLSFDLCTSVFTQTYVSSQAVWRSGKECFSKISNNKFLQFIDRKIGHTRFGFWRKIKWFKKDTNTESENDSSKLNSNIPLPATGEEAMKRLLACKGKDPFSILGVSTTCTDDEIKRYYRRQAFLVHPDKNQQPGAEEAFKILQHAFDLIGEPERREAYERRAQESRHAEAAWSELSQLLAQLHDKMEFAANTIRCTNCGRRHKRVLTDRPCYAARYCSQCKIRHSAKEGDIWAESSMMGLLVMYYACMDGAVYQITQWASCQKKNLKQLRPDCHVVQYRIVLGNKATADVNQRPTAGHDSNLEEFLNNLYSKSASPAGTTTPPCERDVKKRRNKKHK